MSIGLFANYYFGIINNLLINADQRGYVQYNIQIVILVLNSAACIIMITHGVNIQIVKLLSGSTLFNTTNIFILLCPKEL